MNAVWHLCFGKIGATLVFSPFLTMSLMEKMTICLISGLMGKPTVVTFRSEIKEFGFTYRLIRPLIRLSLGRTSAILCQSREARASLAGLFPGCEAKIHIVPNWIEVSSLPPRHSRDKDTTVRLTFMGWLEPNKDVDTILRTVEKTNRQFPNWRLSICGHGSEKERLATLATELGIESKVEFLGWVHEEQKATILQNTDIVLMASLSEGMPNSLVEAMKFGIPIIATNVGGIPTLIENETNGLLFDSGNVDQMSACLRTLISDTKLRQKIGAANIQKILSDHDVETAAKTIIDLLTPVEQGTS